MMPRLSLLSFCFRPHEMRPYICRIVGRYLMVPGFLRMAEGGTGWKTRSDDVKNPR